MKQKITAPALHFRESRWDGAAAILCLILGSIGLRLADDSNLWNRIIRQNEDLVQVGTLNWKKGEIRLKPDASFLWHDVQTGTQGVSGGDTVFTGAEGMASLVFNGGIKAEIFPNSLVVVHLPHSERPTLNIRKGKVKLSLKRKSERIVVSVADKPVSLSSDSPDSHEAKIQVEVNPDNVSEPAQFRTEEDDHVTIQSLSTQDAPVLTLQPSQKVPLEATGTIGTITPLPIAKTTPVVEATPITTVAKSTATPQAIVTAPPLVQKARNRKPQSEPIPEAPPVIENPKVVASTSIKETGNLHEIPIELHWLPVSGVAEYEVSVFNSKNEKFLTRVVNEPQMTLTLKSLDEIEFHYQVSYKGLSGNVVSTALVPITITLSPPIPVEPPNGTLISNAKEGVMVTWQKTALTQDYQLQIAEDPTFSVLLIDQSRSPNFFYFNALADKTYYWRVRSHVGDHTSEWSQQGKFTTQGPNK